MLIAHISKLAGRVGLHGLAPLALLTGTSENTGFLWMGCGDNESLKGEGWWCWAHKHRSTHGAVMWKEHFPRSSASLRPDRCRSASLWIEYKADREASTIALQPQLCPARVCQLILTVSLTRVSVSTGPDPEGFDLTDG